MWTGVWWKALVVALVVLPPLAYVAGTLSSRVDAPEQRPALVLEDRPSSPARTERQVTLVPRPQVSRPPAPPRDDIREGDDDGRDDRGSDDGGADPGDGGVTVVRPAPQEADDDSDDDDDSSDDDSGDSGDDSRDDDGDD